MAATSTSIGIGEVNTFTTASQQTLATHPADPNCAGVIRANVCVRRVSDGATKEFVLEAGFKRGSGNVSIHGLSLLNAFGTVADLVALADVSATIDAIGSDVIIRVEGQNTEMDWSTQVLGWSVNHVAA